ncbi:MAG: hypothetical protein GXC70_01910 [Sphingomonadaceae bacterium]|nr:hypothetical protein [Sphingomonadaceae bacterium]
MTNAKKNQIAAIKPYMVRLHPNESLLDARARWERKTGLRGAILVY